jgi:hypothetical protein
MLKTEMLQKDLTRVGEEISHELAAQMVKDYQTANPTDTKGYYIGRNIIEKILTQPGCAGLQFKNGYDEQGRKTLVYLGIDAFGNPIIEYSVVKSDGSFDVKKGIVADRTHAGDFFEWLFGIRR